MTQEQKAKAYDEALERAKNLYKDAVDMENNLVAKQCEIIFPEIKDSKDEMVRKTLITLLKFLLEDGRAIAPEFNTTKEEAIAWLDKQGENRTITHEEICKSYGISDIGEFSDGFHTFNGLYHQRMILFAVLVKTYKDKAWKSWKHEDGLDCFGGGWFIVGIDTPAGSYTYHYKARDWNRFDCQVLEKAKHWDGHDEIDVERLFTLIQPTEGKTALEAIKEEKVDNTNKVEQKFKIGDWIVWQDKCYKVNDNGCGYELVDQNGLSTSLEYGTIDENAHIWDITKDAKPGDVIVAPKIDGSEHSEQIFIFKEIKDRDYVKNAVEFSCRVVDNEFCTNKSCFMGQSNDYFVPATKEQRDLLFQNMKEAGYEWNSDTKELKTLKE